MTLNKWPLAVLAGLTACQNPADQNASSPVGDVSNVATAGSEPPVAVDIVSLLKAGSPKACDDASVKQAVIGSLKNGMVPGVFYSQTDADRALQSVTFYLDTITLAGANAGISSVSCQANLEFRGGIPLNYDQTYPVNYEVRPSIDQAGGFVVQSDITRYNEHYSGVLTSNALQYSADRDKAAKVATSSPSETAAPPTTPALPAPENASSF